MAARLDWSQFLGPHVFCPTEDCEYVIAIFPSLYYHGKVWCPLCGWELKEDKDVPSD